MDDRHSDEKLWTVWRMLKMIEVWVMDTRLALEGDDEIAERLLKVMRNHNKNGQEEVIPPFGFRNHLDESGNYNPPGDSNG